MTDKIRILGDLAPLLKAQRESAGLSKSELAARAAKVREVIYRLESGEDVTVSSLLAVLGAMRLAMREVKRDPRIPQSLRTDMAAAWGLAG